MTAPNSKPPGRLFVLSAPSGGGKSSLLAALLRDNVDFFYSVSSTTRDRRPGEKNGVHYRFLSKDEFHSIIDHDGFLEHAEVHGNCYGTLIQPIEDALKNGRPCFLDIDIQGLDIILERNKKLGWPITSIFILPPSSEVLERRLRARDTEKEDVIKLRLSNAKQEMERAGQYDFTLVNDILGDALNELKDIIRSFGFKVR